MTPTQRAISTLTLLALAFLEWSLWLYWKYVERLTWPRWFRCNACYDWVQDFSTNTALLIAWLFVYRMVSLPILAGQRWVMGVKVIAFTRIVPAFVDVAQCFGPAEWRYSFYWWEVVIFDLLPLILGIVWIYKGR